MSEEMKTYGQIAYEAYAEIFGRVDPGGTLPGWDDLDADATSAFMAAGRAVDEQVRTDLTVTPAGYQGPAQHTWTAGCAGFHEPGPCPVPSLPPKRAPADWSAMLGQLQALAADWDKLAASVDPADLAEMIRGGTYLNCAMELRKAIGQPS